MTQITNEQIESLLYEEEGTMLDFKRGQYPFEGASKEDKSELLKDILAFTNAFRRSDAFILIGVDEVKGGKSKVVGVAEQLDDAKLQQFVNSKTQRPILFSYREAEHGGLPIGIIHVPVQKRPIYSKANYGIVKKENVYLRRGSSTDIASPDEIAQMGAEQAAPQDTEPAFTLELFDRNTGNSHGHELDLYSTLLEIPEEDNIPNYSQSHEMFSVSVGVNRGYYRELAKFTQSVNFLKPVSLAMRNTGSASAQDVRLVFEMDDPENLYRFAEEDDLPTRPKSNNLFLHARIPLSTTYNADVRVRRTGDTWRIECIFGKIQPQDTVRLVDDLYIGARESGTLLIEALIYADNISNPRPVRFALNFETDSRVVSLDEIEEMERERFFNTEEGKKLLAQMEKKD